MNKIVYLTTIKGIRDSLPEDRRQAFDLQFAGREKNSTVALVLSLFLGGLGIDRFYVGNILLGILKLFTIGLLGLWTIVDWFLIMGAARQKNIEVANEVRMMIA
jgi:TM2 domain-containing membrane protein YozV